MSRVLFVGECLIEEALNAAPGSERGDGVGEGVMSMGDGDHLAVPFLVHLRLATFR